MPCRQRKTLSTCPSFCSPIDPAGRQTAHRVFWLPRPSRGSEINLMNKPLAIIGFVAAAPRVYFVLSAKSVVRSVQLLVSLGRVVASLRLSVPEQALKCQHRHRQTDTHTDTHTHSCTRARTHTHTRRHAIMHAHAHTDTHTRTHLCTRARTHTHTRTHAHTHTHAGTQSRTHTHTHTRTHTHTHTHTLARARASAHTHV